MWCVLDHLRAMKITFFALVRFFILLFCFPVMAVEPVTFYYVSGVSGGGGYNSATEACAAAKPGGYVDSTKSYRCWFTGSTGNLTYSDLLIDSHYGCRPSGSAPDTSKGFINQCPGCTAGATVETTHKTGSGSASSTTATTNIAPYPTSDGYCAVDYKEVVNCYSESNLSGGKDYFCKFRGTADGNTVAQGSAPSPNSGSPSSPDTPSTVPPFNPATGSGKCPTGTVNMGLDASGMSICGGSGSSPNPLPTNTTTKPPTTTTNSDGSNTKTEVTERKNSDGSTTTTTKTTTTGTDGKATENVTSVTGARADGMTGKSDGYPDDSKNDLCKLHPYLNICNNSSVSGSCESLSCTGDAIMCAAAKAAAEQNCRSKIADDAIKASSSYVLGNKLLNGQDPIGSTLPTKANGSAWSMPSSLDQSGWLGGGSCFADKSFVVQGQTVVIPFSNLCQYLIVFRYVSMIISMLIAFKLLSGTILKD